MDITDMNAQKVEAEIAKLMAETAKINAEAKWYPYVAVAGIFTVALAIIKIVA